MTEHKLVDDCMMADRDGVEATCICGWRSGKRFSGMVASALFRDHQAAPAAPVPSSLYDVAREVCHEHGMDWTDPRTGMTYPPPKGDEDGH